jgi:hypothetical protein
MTLGLKVPKFVFVGLIPLSISCLLARWWGFSYLKMLESQEGNLLVFVPAIIQSWQNPNQTFAINDHSGRFLARGSQENLEQILADRGWVLVDRMGATKVFRFANKEFSISCRQFTTHFTVCQP